MPILLDTSVLGRLAGRHDPLHALATQAVVKLHLQGEVLHITPQNLIEFRNFATRPVQVNGLGWTAAEAEASAVSFEALFPLLEDTNSVYPAWKKIVSSLGVIGKQVHDARLVSVCHVYGIKQMMTFNVAHFIRMATFGPGVTIIHPANV